MNSSENPDFGVPARATILAAGLVASLSLAGTALAADSDSNLDLRMGADPVVDTVIYWGGDLNYSRSTRYGGGVGAGFVTALNGDLGASGWTLTGNLGLSSSLDIGSRSQSFYGSLLLGHQWTWPDFYVSLAGGVHYVNNNETPGGGATDGDRLGAIVQYGIETTRTNAFYLQSYGSASTAYNQLYAHVKAGYKAETLRFGGEFTVSDDIGGMPTLRYGAFLGDIPLAKKLSMVVSAGYQHELDPTAPNGFYATIGFAVPLSLR